MDGRILQVFIEDIADIPELANGADNLFMQQHSIPDNNPAVPDEYPRATTTRIGSHQTCRPVGQTSIDKVASTSFDRVTQRRSIRNLKHRSIDVMNVDIALMTAIEPESSDGNRRTNM